MTSHDDQNNFVPTPNEEDTNSTDSVASNDIDRLLSDNAAERKRLLALRKQGKSSHRLEAIAEFKAFYEPWFQKHQGLKIRPSELGVIAKRGSNPEPSLDEELITT